MASSTTMQVAVQLNFSSNAASAVAQIRSQLGLINQNVAGVNNQFQNLNRAIGVGGLLTTLHEINKVTKEFVDLAAKLPAAQMLLYQQGQTKTEIANATKDAFDQHKDVPTASPAGLLKERADMASIITNKEALNVLQQEMRKFEDMPGGGPGQGQAMARILESRFIPGTRDTLNDITAIRKEIETVYKITTLTKGRIQPSDLLLFLNQAGPAGVTMTEDALIKMLPTMQMMKTSRAGTALMRGFDQIMIGGTRVTKAQGALLEQLGMGTYVGGGESGGNQVETLSDRILNNKKTKASSKPAFEFNAEARDLYAKDPVAYITMLVQKINDMNLGKEGSMDMFRTIAKVSGVQNVERLALDLYRTKELGERDLATSQKMPSMDEAYKVYMDSTLEGAMKKFHASLETLAQTLSPVVTDTIIPSINALSDVINKLATIFKDNPDLAKRVGDIVAVTTVLVSAAIAFGAIARMLSFFGVIGAKGAEAGAAGGKVGFGGILGSVFTTIWAKEAFDRLDKEMGDIKKEHPEMTFLDSYFESVKNEQKKLFPAKPDVQVPPPPPPVAPQAPEVKVPMPPKTVVPNVPKGGVYVPIPPAQDGERKEGEQHSMIPPPGNDARAGQIVGVINLDGKRVGSLVAEVMADGMSAPTSNGQAGVDYAQMPILAGSRIFG